MRSAFTLVEILIVVVILGILAAIVVPQFAKAAEEARVASFVTSLKNMEKSLEIYRSFEGSWAPDTSSGTWQAELAGYIKESDFNQGAPVGGGFDIETNDSTITHGVGATESGGETPDLILVQAVDDVMDDGDLTTGRFQNIRGDGGYLILAD